MVGGRGVLALVVLVALAGCTGLAGLDSETPTPEPTPEVTPTPTSTPTPEPTPEATPTPESTPTPEPTPEYDEENVSVMVEQPDQVTLRVFDDTGTDPVDQAVVTLYDETGFEVESYGTVGNEFTFEDLSPGIEYTAEFTGVNGNPLPKTTTQPFDPGQTDELNVTTETPFQQADSFEWRWRIITSGFIDDDTGELQRAGLLMNRERMLVGDGKYDDGDFAIQSNPLSLQNDPEAPDGYTVNIGEEIQTTGVDGDWFEKDKTSWDPRHMPAFAPVRESIYDIDAYEFTYEYERTTTLNDSMLREPFQNETTPAIPEQNRGKEVRVYNITTFWGKSDWSDTWYLYEPERESNARVYVSTETGNVLRWTADERLSPGASGYDAGTGMNPSFVVIDFFNHDGDDIEIDEDDYEPFN